MAFPVIGVIAESGSAHAGHLVRAAQSLGIAVRLRDTDGATVVTEMDAGHQGAPGITVLVARSAHGQAATWPPTRWIDDGGWLMSITPGLDDDLSVLVQRRALAEAAAQGLVGVASVGFDERLEVHSFSTRPDDTWLWTVDACITSAYEQQVRALLDLPLGSTAMHAAMVVTAPIRIGAKPDMYHPYLHLFARDPALRVHQRPGQPGEVVGHLAVLGNVLEDLLERARHAAEYFSGVIEE